MHHHAASGQAVRIDPLGPAIAHLPHPLPISLVRTEELDTLWEQAAATLGELNAALRFLPNADALQYLFLRKEAVLSSQIEGTQSTLSELLEAEYAGYPGVLNDDLKQTLNYFRALDKHWADMQRPQPWSVQLFCSLQGELVQETRGGRKQAGQLRSTQNWIAGSSPDDAQYVPPPERYLPERMQNLCDYLNDTTAQKLEKIAIAHAQFESLHPFLDGNGRVGRMLILLGLQQYGYLQQPILPISWALKEDKTSYYQRLQAIRENGDWASWLAFVARKMKVAAELALAKAAEMQQRERADRERIHAERYPESVLWAFEKLVSRGTLQAHSLTELEQMSAPTAYAALSKLIELGICRELTGLPRGRVYAYESYLQVMQSEL